MAAEEEWRRQQRERELARLHVRFIVFHHAHAYQVHVDVVLLIPATNFWFVYLEMHPSPVAAAKSETAPKQFCPEPFCISPTQYLSSSLRFQRLFSCYKHT